MNVPPSTASKLARLWASLLALLLGYAFVFAPVRQVWINHWLVKDGQEGTAVITKEHWAGHNIVIYRYRVGENVYAGQDHRSWQNPAYTHVQPGEKSVVYFSSSHPWLSAINLPRHLGISGLPFILLAWVIEAGLLITIINPKSRWAFNLSGRREIVPDEWATTGTGRPSGFDARKILKDRIRLVGWALLIVLSMLGIELALDAILTRW